VRREDRYKLPYGAAERTAAPETTHGHGTTQAPAIFPFGDGAVDSKRLGIVPTVLSEQVASAKLDGRRGL
jgi:hypothetical protein